MHKVNFMCGLQRSGSTLLSCILNQNPDIYSSKTSPLFDIVVSVGESIENSLFEYTFDDKSTMRKLFPSVINSYYQDFENKIIFDKSRGWISALELLDEYYPNPKILCTNRSVPEIISSFIRLIEKDKNNLIDKRLKEDGKYPSITNRCERVMDVAIKPALEAVQRGLKYKRGCIHFVEYEDLVNSPKETLDKIYEFMELPRFNHDFLNIENTCKEDKDSNWGIKDLHEIRSKVQKKSTPPEEVLGKELTEYYSQFNLKYS
jgi:sulfotransferase